MQKHGHIHNIGVFPDAIHFGKTENEAEDEQNFRVKEFVSQNKQQFEMTNPSGKTIDKISKIHYRDNSIEEKDRLEYGK